MSKKSKTQAPEKSLPKQNQVSSTGEPIGFYQNIGLVLALVVVFVFLYNNNNAYQWVYKVLLKDHVGFIKKFPDLSYEEKVETKFGLDYSVQRMIVERTDENAVVLFPPSAVIDSVRKAKKMPNRSESLTNKDWIEYYIYPRKMVAYEERATTKLKPTHVAIIGKRGYDLLSYPVPADQRKFRDLLPISK